MNRTDFFESLWNQFIAVTPQADKIHSLLNQRGETPHNDHVAFRTFSDSPIDLAHLVPHLEGLGYRHFQDYDFSAKKLSAASYVHAHDPTAPKIFISELRRELLSPPAQAVLAELIQQIPVQAAGLECFFAGRLWQPTTIADYERLADESEYAGWLAAWGMRANHFTVDLNRLQGFNGLAEFNAFVKSEGFALNQVGGEIKGTSSDLLEQSSTLADRVTVTFADGERTIPSCFYEFALRHPDASGQLYQGFVAANANKIFESTDR